MDLRSVLNTSDNADRAPQKPPLNIAQQQQQQQQQSSARLSQSPAQYNYREYPQPHHASPGRTGSQEYPQHHAQYSGNIPPPSPYQNSGPYPPRAGAPMQVATGFHDSRSPSGSAPAQSPYRPSLTPSTSGGGAPGYPFPPAQATQEIQSPSQRHQYPPAQFQAHRRDSFSQNAGPHPTTPYIQQHAIPQTPPIVTTGGAIQQQQIHQRSQSAHSTPTPTPTSAQSQHQFGAPLPHGSPTRQPPMLPTDISRNSSQPPTPIGPPHQSNSRQASFQQPHSPYQPKHTSLSTGQAIHAHGPPDAPIVQEPIRRLSLTKHAREPLPHETVQRARSYIEREQSMSVSPKTRIGTLPNKSDRVLAAESNLNISTSNQKLVKPENMPNQPTATPAKRKLDDSNVSPRELENRLSRPPPGETNGRDLTPAERSAPPAEALRKKRFPRAQPPIWAQDAAILKNKMPHHPNFVLQKRHVNGKSEGASKSAHTSRHATPEAARTRPVPLAEPDPRDILGAWEPSIMGVKPLEEVSRAVADFLFIHILNASDLQEILSRNIQFEVEAKLGTLIDRDTNHRVEKQLASECILRDNGRTAFKSSMTETHHKAFNDFLNNVVVQTHPRPPNSGNRVQVVYKHRRELDRFIELPQELQAHVPGCMMSRLGRRKPRVRVTYDQKTNQVLEMIIKARVADIELHLPTCPMDCRISINLEMSWDGPVEELEQLAAKQTDRQPDRSKDRLSYTQGHYQIDLTQVTQTVNAPGNNQRLEKEHELEIELSSKMLIDQGRKAMNGGAHRYQELVDGFVDNIRVLARKARDF